MRPLAAPAHQGLACYSSVDDFILETRPTEPVYCLHPGTVREIVSRYLSGFPGDVLYAVKSNPALPLLDSLYAAGIRHFDTASLPEISTIKQRYPDAHCYYMAPVRLLGTSADAYHTFGVTDFVFDSDEELAKILRETGNAKDLTLYVRLKADVGGAVLELSSKFGTQEIDAARLLQRVADAGCRPALAFHVGSLCSDPDAFFRALQLCEQVRELADVDLAALDVGGGFPAPYQPASTPRLEAYFDRIRASISSLNLGANVRYMCEPGRGLSAFGISVVTQVIGRRGDRVYLNDGIYGNFSEMCIPNSHIVYPNRVVRVEGNRTEQLTSELRPFTIFGPTCDTLDVLPHLIDLPTDIQMGDFIHFGLMGAYSYSNRTNFNGFYPSTFVEIDDGAPPPPGLDDYLD